MLLEALMARHGWSDLAWTGPVPLRWYIKRPRWFVGVWTGPQHDLICVRHASTNEEAEALLSPAGWTPLHAALLAAKKSRHVNVRCGRAARSGCSGVRPPRTGRAATSSEGGGCDDR